MGLLSTMGLSRENTQLPVGARAPQLTVLNEDGEKVETGALWAEGLSFIYFYPKALTPVCTAQGCELRDNFAKLTEAGLRLYGISRDNPDTIKRFKTRHQFPFTMLSDRDGRLCKAFGVPIIFSVSLRQTFLLKDGAVAWRDLHPQVGNQVETVLAALPNVK